MSCIDMETEERKIRGNLAEVGKTWGRDLGTMIAQAVGRCYNRLTNERTSLRGGQTCGTFPKHSYTFSYVWYTARATVSSGLRTHVAAYLSPFYPLPRWWRRAVPATAPAARGRRDRYAQQECLVNVHPGPATGVDVLHWRRRTNHPLWPVSQDKKSLLWAQQAGPNTNHSLAKERLGAVIVPQKLHRFNPPSAPDGQTAVRSLCVSLADLGLQRRGQL